MKTKTYKAAVTNKETGKLEVITRDDYTSKKDFAHDLRVNGYAVRFISTPEKFDEDCENYYWKSEERKHARIVAKQHKSQPAKQTEENKDTFEYRNYIISGNERTGIIAIDNHGNFSPKVYKTVEEAKKAVDEDIEYAEKKYAEMEAEQTEVEETAENAAESAEVKTDSEVHLDEEIAKTFEKQKSSFKFYDVDMAYQVERYVNCGSLKYVQLGTYSDYSKAVQAAYEAIKEWGEEHIYFHTVEMAKRNSKATKDKYDEKILKSEKKEIGYYWYASRLTDSKECVHISIDSPIRIPIETAQKSEIEEVKETVETETAKNG